MKPNPNDYASTFLTIFLCTCLPVVLIEGNNISSTTEQKLTEKYSTDTTSLDSNNIGNFSIEKSNIPLVDTEESQWMKIKRSEIDCLIYALYRANESSLLGDTQSANKEEWRNRNLMEDICKQLSLNGAFLEINDSWSDAARLKLVHHIREQLLCYIEAVKEYQNDSLSKFCPRVWDKILCWPPAPPDTESSIRCTHFNNATRYCDKRGRWFNSSEKDQTGYTNYSACFAKTFPFEQWLPVIKQISITGYTISLVTLIISFAILISLRKLRCPRNILHLHLFASFIFRALVILLKASFQDKFDSASTGQLGGSPPNSTSPGTWWCKLAIVLWQYFIVANYSWILMEGLYLHNLIFMALFSDSSAITLYISLGWGIPSFFVLLWATLRATLDELGCWTVHNNSWIFWMCIRLPVAISNLVNFFFFLNVTRVLFSKFRSSVNPESMKYRKLAKSTLVLVPLFGVPYFLLWGLSTSADPTVELVWLFLDQTFASFQGFFVAVLYCLMNGEVRQEVMRQYYRFKGETFTNASHSTVMSHTKTFLSRGRTSISIHSGDREHKSGVQTPSPQMQRSNAYQDNTNTFYKEEYSPIKSRSPELSNLVEFGSNSSSRVIDTIEMIPCAVPMSANSLLQTTKTPAANEEEVPLLFVDEPSAIKSQVDTKVNYHAIKPEWDQKISNDLNLNSSIDKHSDINKTSESLILLASGNECSENTVNNNKSSKPNQLNSKQKDLYVTLNAASQATHAFVAANGPVVIQNNVNQESIL